MNEEGSLEEMKEIINSNGYKLANYCDQYFNPANNLSINSIKKLYFNTFCYFCGNKDIHLHHIIPRCKGGIDEKENLIPLCKKHHKLIHNKSHFLHFKEGFYYLKEQKTNKKKGKPCKEQFVLCRDPPHKSIEISLYFKKFNSRQENVE